jgi:hypothetical protein
MLNNAIFLVSSGTGGKGGWRSGGGKSRHISGEDFYTFSLDGLLPSYGDPSQVRIILMD